MSFCETCIKDKGQAYPMHEAEARMHVDNNPGHEIVAVDKTEADFEAGEQEAEL